jgi:hypothetical protein
LSIEPFVRTLVEGFPNLFGKCLETIVHLGNHHWNAKAGSVVQ